MLEKDFKPDYLGFWDNNGVAQRYFYFKDKSVMIDSLGVSEVSDFKFDSGKASFTKKYKHLTKAGRANKIFQGKSMVFRANLEEEGFYFGHYKDSCAGKDSKIRGGFTFERFIQSKSLEETLSAMIKTNRIGLVQLGILSN